MLRIAGVLILLVTLYVTLRLADENAFGSRNLIDVANRQGFYGVLTLGVAVLIVTGAIDLSIGSVAGLAAITFGLLMGEGVRPIPAAGIVLLGGMLVGLAHGLLVTRLKLQAFLVTLCGLFIYRGIARYISKRPVGLSDIQQENPSMTDSIDWLRWVLIGKDENSALLFPAQLFVMIMLAVAIGFILHKSVIGRYWYAIGYNESAARYSGIATDRYRVLAFVISSTLASLGGILMLLDVRTADPNTAGTNWELFAITGAVLGGCSLKGGEGTAIGILLGAAVLPLLQNAMSFVEINGKEIPDSVIPVVIGLTLLLGTIVDEFFRRRAAVRK
ncbi:MAG: ABC transporter permease [Gemmataceae bacterium]|nr:ABC transporter permease [Gemmataceae bacterium]